MKNQLPQLGVCYYPEHWPKEQWSDDARRMAELGIAVVRIGEFAWSRLEPSRGDYQLDWLHDAIECLHLKGLKVVIGTPTATPPKWLVDEMPDMFPVSQEGDIRGFGSRRHYCFSHSGYREECARIVRKLAETFGEHPAVIAWQTDNEYDCHDTTLSWSKSALESFHLWLRDQYHNIDALNVAWGNVFWSMEYSSFNQIPLPGQAVTEENPAHRLDFRRFASDKLVDFNKLQTQILRELSPGRDILHNFMGRTLTFDHFDVGLDLDISSWDSYPLGFLEDRSDRCDDFKKQFSQSGDPDNQAFHHDLYRATSKGRWWVMEQQPGPVNWAPHNPIPRDGMVRLWTWEAIAHGAEVVSYFRWKQAPFAQEQMHAGLLRPDGKEAQGFYEAQQVTADFNKLRTSDDLDAIANSQVQADVAIVFDYPSAWAWEIQPQGAEFDYFRLIFDFYSGLRSHGLTVDFISAKSSELSNYKAVIIAGLFTWSKELKIALETYEGQVLIGPRTGSKTPHFSIPTAMPPDLSSDLLDVVVTRVATLRSDNPLSVDSGAIQIWREELEHGPPAKVLLQDEAEKPILVQQGNISYLAGWPDSKLMKQILCDLMEKACVPTIQLPDAIRITRRGDYLFVVNYGDEAIDLSGIGINGTLHLGENLIAASGVTILSSN